MRALIEIPVFLFLKFLLSLRYRIKVKGRETLHRGNLKKEGGVLFLANHTSELDPVMVLIALWRKFKPRPLVLEQYYDLPTFNWLMRRVRAIPVPSFQTSSSNRFQLRREGKLFQTVAAALRKGENILINPSGGLKRAALEVIGGTSLVQRLIQEIPESNVVLVRTMGLWGSSFSKALTGRTPPFQKTLLQWFKAILKNLVFFTPRRDVMIELALAGEDFPRRGSRREVNHYLEHWYNRSEEEKAVKGEPLKLVSYSRWRKVLLEVKSAPEKPRIEMIHVPSEIRKTVQEVLARMTGLAPSEIRDEMNLSEHLRLDSIDAAELLAFLEESYNVSAVQLMDLTTVGAVMSIAAGQMILEREEEMPEVDFSYWYENGKRPPVIVPEGKTIQEVFLRSCDRMGKAAACADAISGVIPFQRLKIGVLLLAQYLKKLPEERIGVLLPASIAADVLILACMMAGKVPVMMNWTVGPRHLDRIVEISQTKVILTSWRFLERLGENIEFPKRMEDQMVMLEDIRRSFTLRDKLKAKSRSKKSLKVLLSLSCLKNVNEEAIAVILFTSGSEALPKGVPLTHRNLLSNLRATVQVIDLQSQDVLLGFLPPFHSFGFTVAGLWPLLAGLKVAHSPNPIDGLRLARDIEKWKVTLVPGAPTFLRTILKVATLEELKSVRLFISGAEKMPKNLQKEIQDLGADKRFIEGYGITECSPILTMARMDQPCTGVGPPVPEVELCIVNPETCQVLPKGREGLILACGPNVFKGYLEATRTSPFVEVSGKSWYRTGDIGYLDSEGCLTLSGRMKRFVKIGGEMISLVALEEALEEAFRKKEAGLDEEKPSLAICAREEEGERTQLVLMTTLQTTVQEVNQILKEFGFGNIVKFSQVQQLPEIPLLATGKVNYRLLEEKLNDS